MDLIKHFTNKDIYFCSDSDLDGISGRIIYQYYVQPIAKNSIILNTCDRTMIEFNIKEALVCDIVIFVDITPTLELLKRLQEDNKEVFIFDHHCSGYDVVHGNIADDHYFFTVEKCGCRIFFDELNINRRVKKCVYQFVERVDIYDRFILESSLWKEAKDLHNIMYGTVDWKADLCDTDKYNKFIDNQLYKLHNDKQFYFTEHERTLAFSAEKKEKQNLDLGRNTLSIRKDNSNNKYGYFECSSKLSYVAMMLLREHQDIQYLVGYATWQEDARGIKDGKVSLRSQENFDVRPIAEKYSGGGHKNASGVKLPLDIFDYVRSGKSHLI